MRPGRDELLEQGRMRTRWRGMATVNREKVFDSPLHVVRLENGCVRILLPDGHSLTLTPDAALRSAGMLKRGAQRMGADKVGTVIAVDFARPAANG